ncbi:MAG: hypothetical protein WBK28_01485 [Minisyncoccia bacterium]
MSKSKDEWTNGKVIFFLLMLWIVLFVLVALQSNVQPFQEPAAIEGNSRCSFADVGCTPSDEVETMPSEEVPDSIPAPSEDSPRAHPLPPSE